MYKLQIKLGYLTTDKIFYVLSFPYKVNLLKKVIKITLLWFPNHFSKEFIQSINFQGFFTLFITLTHFQKSVLAFNT